MDALSLIQKHEGFRPFVYDDANDHHVVPGYTMVGHPTIGYGRCLDTDGLSPDEATWLTQNELDKARIPDLKTIFTTWWDGFGGPRQAVLLDMHYALGPSGFRGFHQFITAVMNGEWAAAKAAMLDSHWGKEAPDRVAEDADILLNGVFPS